MNPKRVIRRRKKMGNKALLEQRRNRIIDEINSVKAWIVRHHGPGPYTVWDDDTFKIGIKQKLVEELNKKLKRIEEELGEFNRRERGEIHPLTRESIQYGFERNVVNWGVSAHKGSIRLPIRTLRIKAEEVANKLIEIPEIYFPTPRKSVQFRYLVGDYQLVLDFFEDWIEIAKVPYFYYELKELGLVLEIPFKKVSYEDIDVINSAIREFYETDNWTKRQKWRDIPQQ